HKDEMIDSALAGLQVPVKGANQSEQVLFGDEPAQAEKVAAGKLIEGSITRRFRANRRSALGKVIIVHRVVARENFLLRKSEGSEIAPMRIAGHQSGIE